SPLKWSSAKPIYHQPPFTASSDFQDVSCPSPSLCVAVDGDGNVVSSTQPTASASAWKVTRVPGRPRFGHISCPSRSLCVAVGANGVVATSRHPTGGGRRW